MQTHLLFELEERLDKGFERSEAMSVDFEFFDPSILMNDVEKFMYSVIHEYMGWMALEDEKANNPNHVGRTVTIKTTCLGVPMEFSDTLTADFGKEQVKRAYDMDSIQNDIRYIDNMITSEAPILDVRKWIYHTLNKHFDVEIPEALKPDTPVVSNPVEASDK